MQKVNFLCTLLSIVFFALLSFQTDAQINSNEDESLEKLRRQIDSLYQSKIEADGPGAALLISYGERRLISKGFGLRDLESKEPITSHTNLRLGSVSKQFTDLAILNLIEDGLLSLKDTVGRILPVKIFSEITIEQLMHHTSGLALIKVLCSKEKP